MRRPRSRGQVEDRHDLRITSRHPGDALRVVLGSLLLAVSVLGVRRDRLTTFERNLFRLVNDLPSELAVVLGPLMELGNVIAAPVVGVAVFLATRRHRRVALDVTVAGLVAWWGAKVVKSVIERPRPVGFIVDANRLLDSGLGFVSGHTAVAAAIVTAASPYLPRRWRRAVWVLPWIVGLARIFYGAHLPLDIVGGAALGWVIGAGLHLLAGAPHRVPTLDDAAAVMRRTGRGHWSVHRVATEAKGSFPFVADDGSRRVFVKLLDPEPRDRDRLYRIARFLAFRDVRDEVALGDARAQADHEAALSLLARAQGVRTPRVRAVEVDGGQVWIVQDHVEGRPIDEIAPATLADTALDELWRHVERLREAGIAHRDLVASNILLDGEGRPWLVDFAHARTTHEGHPFDNDVAELLVTTAAVVGPERAVAAARRVLEPEGLAAALAELQPLALSAEARARLRDDDTLLDAVRHEVSHSSQVVPAAPPSPPVPPARRAVRIASSVGAVVALLAVTGPGAVVGSFEGDTWRWSGFAALAALAMVVASAVALLAAIDRRLAVGRTCLLRLGEMGHSLLGGRRSGHELVVRQLGRAGVPAGEAVAGLVRRARVRRLVVLVAALVAVPALVVAEPDPSVDGRDLAMAAIAVVAALLDAGAVGPGPASGPPPGTSVDHGERTRAALWTATAVQLAATIAGTAGLAAATGAAPPLAGIAVVQLAAVALALIGPLSMGSGATTAVVATGLGLLGMPAEAAVAAALASSAVLFWAPSLAAWLVPGRRAGSPGTGPGRHPIR